MTITKKVARRVGIGAAIVFTALAVTHFFAGLSGRDVHAWSAFAMPNGVETARAQWDHGKGRFHRGPKWAWMAIGHLRDMADTDGDGAVTDAEIDAYATGQFASADRDGDRQLTVAEFQPIWVAATRPTMVRAF